MTSLLDASWPRTTERLTLRPITAADADDVWRIRCEPAVDEWTGGVLDRIDFDLRFVETDPPETVVVIHEGRLIGDLWLCVTNAWAQHPVRDEAQGVEAVLGWCFDPAVHGRGFATEAVTEGLHVLFDELGVRRVKAEAFADNLPSRRVMERVGMRHEGTGVADSLHRDRGWLDGVTYALLADEWRDRSHPSPDSHASV